MSSLLFNTDSMSNIEEMLASEWYQTRPDVIKQAIDVLPPTQLYRFKESGKQCYVYSYEEPENGKLEDVTVTVQKTGEGGVLAEFGLGELDTNKVFGVKLDSLEVVPIPLN